MRPVNLPDLLEVNRLAFVRPVAPNPLVDPRPEPIGCGMVAKAGSAIDAGKIADFGRGLESDMLGSCKKRTGRAGESAAGDSSSPTSVGAASESKVDSDRRVANRFAMSSLLPGVRDVVAKVTGKSQFWFQAIHDASYSISVPCDRCF